MPATAAQLNAFIQYLNDQCDIMVVDGVSYGQPYVWGGQHTHLTPSNYINTINSMEANTGGYGGMTYAQMARYYCRRLFNAGATDLYAYDCSGLGMYYWWNVAHVYSGDKNANAMMYDCTLYPDDPKRGWWVFKVNSTGRAYHIGYMVDNTHVVEALGRMDGVKKSTFSRATWQKWGIPKILKEVIPAPGDPGHTWVHFMSNYLWASGGNYFFPPH